MAASAADGPPSLANQIRSFVYQHYVVPTVLAGRSEILVRAGDVHRDMRLVSRMPAVCSALGTKFEHDYQVELLDRSGSAQGSNVYFRFRVLPGPDGPHFEASNCKIASHSRAQDQERCYDYQRSPFAQIAAGTAFFVSCVSQKRGSPSPAKHLYISPWFLKARRYVEQRGAPWFILSAEYGLLSPDQVVDPYERTLKTMSVDQRRSWADRVIAQLCKAIPDARHMVFLAGAAYRENLVGHLRLQGISVTVPMEGLRIGEQLRWLGRV